jgi:thiol-disulfide isomerase/thioredoxin
MGFVRLGLLYTALLAFANAASAEERLAALLDGDMRKLVFHEVPVAVPEMGFADLNGAAHSLAEYRGKWVLLNFWATWCAPCRKEMPMLDALEAEFGGGRFAVVTIATGRNSPEGIRRFFSENGVAQLPMYIDPRQEFGRAMGVFGLPVTVLIDPEGQETARMLGEADWASESAKALIAALLAGE